MYKYVGQDPEQFTYSDNINSSNSY